MGRDKAALVLAGRSLAELAVSRLGAVCEEVLIAAAGRLELPGFAAVEDGPGRGPAAGILGAAAARPGRRLLVLACDLPGVEEALLRELSASRGCDWAVPRWSRGLEPLCALYTPPALAALARLVARGSCAPHRLEAVAELEVRYLDEEVLRRFGAPRILFHNLNTPADLAAWEHTRG